MLSVVILINLLLVSSLFIIKSYGAAEEIDAKFGEVPVIDGDIDDSTDEWKKKNESKSPVIYFRCLGRKTIQLNLFR